MVSSNEEELQEIAENGLKSSPVTQPDCAPIAGFKGKSKYEVMDTQTMRWSYAIWKTFDPVGTGDSIVPLRQVRLSQTANTRCWWDASPRLFERQD